MINKEHATIIWQNGFAAHDTFLIVYTSDHLVHFRVVPEGDMREKKKKCIALKSNAPVTRNQTRPQVIVGPL